MKNTRPQYYLTFLSGVLFFISFLKLKLIGVQISFNGKSRSHKLYTFFQKGRHFSILLFPCKVNLLTSLSNVKLKRIINLERDKNGQFALKQKNTKMVAISSKVYWPFHGCELTVVTWPLNEREVGVETLILILMKTI